MSSTASEAAKAMTKLSITPTSSASKAKSKKKQVVADSWEDEESSASEAETEPPTPSKPDNTTQAGVAAPPPTPISPSYGRHGPDGNSTPWVASNSTAGGSYGYRDAQGEGGVRRPEKTDAVARRMIASALGVRAPKQTEEQKAYDRAVREKERKKREEEREVERSRAQEAEKAKAAIWDD
ncbi:hypothetical protein F5B22DRAFT_258615 [Xylaria bambusicola]|uniref:uncharacterized protein n=1 Tax=Xylaria bambusicola TaxID=326684 RepID=UPI002008B650|nr:uncharacterized protein F5B22DRAFT_258615 [Xylaria bambusicola]KAI0525902.1 hypothetical protein F5B22DRAFT_258615 [Xylaria bambusicola]